FPVPVLFIIGAVLLLLVVAFIWSEKRERDRQALLAAEPTVDEIDPFAGGFPVPPLPGQRLVESRGAHTPSATSSSSTGDDAPVIVSGKEN
ncbi:MAG: hypothetical protein GX344_12190, partial [Intrasporangiaceae bacterium]|nr:hypothetical protein [Intrasporangiaceae bacterium]